MFGKISETSFPHCPYLLNLKMPGMIGPGRPSWTRTSPPKTWPAYFSIAGLYSKVSIWLTPPVLKIEMTAFARGLKCGAFGARGLPPIGAAAQTSIGGVLRKQFLIEEHLSEGQPADAAAGLKQKIAPIPDMFHFDYLVYKNSLRLSMTFVKSTSEPDKIMSVANESSLCVGGRVSAIR